MKILGLHWVFHVVYLSALFGGLYVGMRQLREAAFLKKDIGEVQEISLRIVHQGNDWPFVREINKTADAYQTPENEAYRRAANQAIGLVDLFSKKCEALKRRLFSGTPAARIDWTNELLMDYYQLGDALKVILPQNAQGQEWLDRCLFSDYRACPQKQLNSWLVSGDSAEVHLIIQNLNLKAELALYSGLSTLQKQTKGYYLIFDAMLPVITYTDCPRAGQPFEAKVTLAPYSASTQNIKAKINGQFVPVENGLVHYEVRSATSHPPAVNVQFIVKNPLTGEQKPYFMQMQNSSPEN